MDGKTLRTLRLHFGLDQKTFAQRLGVSVSAVSMMERGERVITDRTKMRIASNFDLDEDYFDSLAKFERLNNVREAM